jgi:hypothetical protein
MSVDFAPLSFLKQAPSSLMDDWDMLTLSASLVRNYVDLLAQSLKETK